MDNVIPFPRAQFAGNVLTGDPEFAFISSEYSQDLDNENPGNVTAVIGSWLYSERNGVAFRAFDLTYAQASRLMEVWRELTTQN